MITNSEEKIFDRDTFLLKENERLKGFYVITRGGCTESNNKPGVCFREKRGIGHIISMHHLAT